MKRQKVRRLLIFLSFMLFPITMWYFSPYLIIQAVAQHILNGSFWVFTAMLVLLILFLPSVFHGRRATCHYICWMAPFMTIGSWIGRKLHLPQLQRGVLTRY